MNLQYFAAGEDIAKVALVQRYQRVAFMNTGTREVPVWQRMQGFSTFSESKSTKEYSRQYVDEQTERSDVSGYSTEISFTFDRYSPYKVHDTIAEMIDGEKLGTDCHVEILTVDLFTKDETGNCKARYREYAVIPDNAGDSTDAMTYSGTLKAAGDFKETKATVAADGLTATEVKE